MLRRIPELAQSEDLKDLNGNAVDFSRISGSPGAERSSAEPEPSSAEHFPIAHFWMQPKGAPARGGPKKGTFFDTFIFTWTITGKSRDCHSELGSWFFAPTLVSVVSSVTELRIETRVGRKGPERSSGSHLRVQKWRKKVNFLAKSSGKMGGVS